jgi:hypothetical protein
MEVSGQIHAPASLPRGQEYLVPLDRRLVGICVSTMEVKVTMDSEYKQKKEFLLKET